MNTHEEILDARSTHKKKIQTQEYPWEKLLDPWITHDKKFGTHEYTREKKFETLEIPRKNKFAPTKRAKAQWH